MSVGYEKVYLLQNSLNMETSDIFSTYVYRVGLQQVQYSLSTNSIVGETRFQSK